MNETELLLGGENAPQITVIDQSSGTPVQKQGFLVGEMAD
jgi:hypothetical protein